jgi:hypothetical protein
VSNYVVDYETIFEVQTRANTNLNTKIQKYNIAKPKYHQHTNHKLSQPRVDETERQLEAAEARHDEALSALVDEPYAVAEAADGAEIDMRPPALLIKVVGHPPPQSSVLCALSVLVCGSAHVLSLVCGWFARGFLAALLLVVLS